MSVKREWGLRGGLWPLMLFCIVFNMLGGSATANAAAACAGEAAMALRITAAALAPDIDRTLVVQVFDDGCVQVHRPAFRRDAGDFRLDLDAAALDALRRKVDQPLLRSFDAKRVQADIAAGQRKRSTQDGREQRYSELDGDIHELSWRSGNRRGSAAWPGLPGDAKNNPDNETLRVFHNAAIALQSLAERGDAARIAGGRP